MAKFKTGCNGQQRKSKGKLYCIANTRHVFLQL